MNAKERLEAWQFVNEWERTQTRSYPSIEELLDWLSDGLALARAATPFPEETIEEKVARIAEWKRIFSVVGS